MLMKTRATVMLLLAVVWLGKCWVRYSESILLWASCLWPLSFDIFLTCVCQVWSGCEVCPLFHENDICFFNYDFNVCVLLLLIPCSLPQWPVRLLLCIHIAHVGEGNNPEPFNPGSTFQGSKSQNPGNMGHQGDSETEEHILVCTFS